MNTILAGLRKNLNIYILALSIAASVVLSFIDLKSPLFSIGIIIGITLVAFITKKPVNGLIMLIMLHPFSGTPLLDSRIGGIPGLKIFNLASLLIMVIFLLFRKPEPTRKSEKFLVFGVVILLTIAIIRAIPYIQEIGEIWSFDLDLSRFIQTYLIKAIFIFLPSAIIIFYIRGEEAVERVVYGVIGSIMLLSFGLIIILLFFTPDKSNFELIRDSFQKVFVLHGNDLADFYISIYPIILAFAANKKSKVLIVCIIITLVSVGILYSRTAYLVIIFSTVLFLIISKRARLLPYLMIFAVVAFMFIPASIKDRAETGLDNQSTMNDITAGRTDKVWMPLINEYLQSPAKMLIGDGRFSIIHTRAYKDGLIYKVEHAHNAYLDTILDTGILGLMFFVGMFFLYLWRFFKAHDRLRGSPLLLDLLRGIEVSTIAFLISGITGRVFFPVYLNTYTWITLALGIAIINTANYSMKENVFEDSFNK